MSLIHVLIIYEWGLGDLGKPTKNRRVMTFMDLEHTQQMALSFLYAEFSGRYQSYRKNAEEAMEHPQIGEKYNELLALYNIISKEDRYRLEVEIIDTVVR